MRNDFGKNKSFYHVLIKHNTAGATYYDRLLDRREQAYAWCSTEQGVPSKSPFLCNALFCNAQSTTKTNKQANKTLHA